MSKELIIDSFAGGGGASLGIELAMGRSPDIAINHDANAIAMHEANHPSTLHVLEDVWKADLRKLVVGRKVGWLHASPDCKHFSRAKGSVPVSKEIRSLAWVVVRWASQVRPKIISLENVREFADWSPVVPRWECSCGWKGTEGQAILERHSRRCPRCSSKRLSNTGQLMPDPAKKGVTFRLFVNRLKGLGYAVEWRDLDAADYGSPTHRRRLFLIARCDGREIVWPKPTHCDPRKADVLSLKPWRTAAECIDWSIECPSIFDRKRPLKDATLKRIAAGIKRFVLDAEVPFIVPITHTGERRNRNLNEPMPTITAAKRGEFALAVPILSKYHGQKGEESRCRQLELPFGTLDTQPRYALVAPVIERMFSSSSGASVTDPLPTTMAGGGGKSALVTAFIAKHYGGMVGVSAETPLPTTTTRGTQNQVVEATLSPVAKPGSRATEVYAFLMKYYGTAIGQQLNASLGTITTKDRFGLVTVSVGGEEYAIIDIGMRMLTARELARAQGFPDSYKLTGSKTSQVARIGNSVCPQVAEALVKANMATRRIVKHAT